MKTPLRSTPKDVFLQLLAMVLLYLSVIHFITIVFQYINYSFPDSLDYYPGSVYETIRWASASLVVIFPVFLLTSWIIGRDFSHAPARRELGFRKWLIYITLFVASLTIIIDLVYLIYNFYEGELTLTFTLKALTILIVTGMIFGYLLWDLNTPSYQPKRNQKLAIGSLTLVLITIIAGFFVVGSPWEQRKVRFDEQRVSALQNLQYEIINYWQNKGSLPNELDDLRNSITGYVPPADPETGIPYEYNVKGPLTFELCATFLTSTSGQKMHPQRFPVGYGWMESNWGHEAGRTCFERTIDPDFYPKRQE